MRLKELNESSFDYPDETIDASEEAESEGMPRDLTDLHSRLFIPAHIHIKDEDPVDLVTPRGEKVFSGAWAELLVWFDEHLDDLVGTYFITVDRMVLHKIRVA